MDYEREPMLAFLEEDNTQRAYFRVRPLLTPSGFAQEEALRLWPDEGGLRIVPDKNEQCYFKDRMRSIGSFCMVDLTPFPAEANKIRTNKNYRPEKEEKNQYIIFSDTIHPLPEHTFYEVIAGTADSFADAAAAAITPLFMLRDGDTLYGPVSKAEPAAPSPAPEMQAMLFSLPCPDGKERSILCRKEAVSEAPDAAPKKEAPAARPAPQPASATAEAAHQPEEELPLGKELHILDETKDFQATLNDIQQLLPSSANLLHAAPEPVAEPAEPAPQSTAPLTGTPLMRGAAVRTSTPRPKNKVQEVVSSQWRAVRNDPPAEPLPAGAQLRSVANPVESACDHLRAAWNIPEVQQQLIDYILSLPGMSMCLTSARDTTLQQTLQSKLNDLEAERLSLLYQLDKAQSDLDAFRKQEIANASRKARASVQQLQEQQSECEAALTAVKEQMNALLAQRDALQAEIAKLQQEAVPQALADALARAQLVTPPSGCPLYLNGRSGVPAEPAALLDNAVRTAAAAGMTVSRNAAAAMLALLAACTHMAVITPAIAPAATMIANAMAAFGWESGLATQTNPAQQPIASPAVCDSTPLVLVSSATLLTPVKDVFRIVLSEDPAAVFGSAAYKMSPYPVLRLDRLPFIPALEPEQVQPQSIDALRRLAVQDAGNVQKALAPILELVPPISGDAMAQLQRFVNVAAPLMDGGLPAACDWAIRLWLLPRAAILRRDALDQLRPLLAEYPMSAALL